MSPTQFRFGHQLTSGDADQVLANATAAEAAGFDVVHTFDHVGEVWPPLGPLAAIASVTERVRLCPLVINNDFQHPVQLAREIAALDQFTGGRMELGIGAGHSFTEYEAIGVVFDPPATRKARLSEAVEIIRGLLDGDTVSFSGTHYRLRDVRITRTLQAHLPILVGVNGNALAHAARPADTIGLTMLGRTLDDGQRHETRWEVDRLDRTVTFIREEASGRSTLLELHVLIQAIIVTNDRKTAVKNAVASGWTPTTDDALHTPFLAIGTHSEVAAHLLACRERWGISYFTVRDIDAFAPVIQPAPRRRSGRAITADRRSTTEARNPTYCRGVRRMGEVGSRPTLRGTARQPLAGTSRCVRWRSLRRGTLSLDRRDDRAADRPLLARRDR